MTTPLSFAHTALGANTSNLTGAAWFTGDFRQMTISIQSASNSASRYTVIGTNDDGLRAALNTPSQNVPANGWSIVTVITSQGLYAFDPYPGFRWMNVFRDASSLGASNVTVRLTGRT